MAASPPAAAQIEEYFDVQENRIGAVGCSDRSQSLPTARSARGYYGNYGYSYPAYGYDGYSYPAYGYSISTYGYGYPGLWLQLWLAAMPAYRLRLLTTMATAVTATAMSSGGAGSAA